MKTHYSDFCCHAMRFYVKSILNSTSAEPHFKTDADKKNWYACRASVKSFSPEDMGVLLALYSMNMPTPDAVSRVAKERKMSQDHLWNIVHELERKIAKRRGLI